MDPEDVEWVARDDFVTRTGKRISIIYYYDETISLEIERGASKLAIQRFENGRLKSSPGNSVRIVLVPYETRAEPRNVDSRIRTGK